MKLSMHATTLGAAVFAVICLVAGINGLLSLDRIDDAAQMADAKGFAWFWTFLGCISVVIALLASWLSRTPDSGADTKPLDDR